MIMKAMARVKTARRRERDGRGLVLPPPFTGEQFAQFRAMIDHGTGAAEGVPSRVRVEAMEAMDILKVRDPQRLGELLVRFNQGSALVELVAYRVSRRSGG